MALADNKRSRFDYDILEEFKAGVELLGFEVKSVKAGKISLTGSYVIIRGSEAYLLNADIPPYQKGNEPEDYDSRRNRKLLLTKKEISYLEGKIHERGLTLVPIKVYNSKGIVKILVGLAKHKKSQDKRATITEREVSRDISRQLKNKQ